MNLCSDNHDEVAFEGRRCPVCLMKAELDAEIEKLQNKLSDALDEINTLSEKA